MGKSRKTKQKSPNIFTKKKKIMKKTKNAVVDDVAARSSLAVICWRVSVPATKATHTSDIMALSSSVSHLCWSQELAMVKWFCTTRVLIIMKIRRERIAK
ncbi:hypothetical protein RND81_02G079100 [Saponaria officinalis]|uniref:Uncharacterized protein n=1 Tax=Saponaria officinalis TaxID=3572 RepID=A0AAW1MSH8_SAPOF